jgi:hypothetical protein
MAGTKRVSKAFTKEAAAAQRRQRKEHGQRRRARSAPAQGQIEAWQRIADQAKKKT